MQSSDPKPKPEGDAVLGLIVIAVIVLSLLGVGLFSTLRPDALKAKVVYGEF